MAKVRVSNSRYDELIKKEVRLELIEEKMIGREQIRMEDILIIIGSERAMSRVRELRAEEQRQIEEYQRRMAEQQQPDE